MPDLKDIFDGEHRDRSEHQYFEDCLVANDVAAADDEVFVTFPHSDEPRLKEPVTYWRPGINVDATVRLPEQGDRGVVLYLSNGDTWLIF